MGDLPGVETAKQLVIELLNNDYKEKISSNQNSEFSFEASLAKEVDMKKIDIDGMKSWICQRVFQILGKKNDEAIEFIFNQLETKDPDPRKMQISLTGVLNAKNARIFMGELWKLLYLAQNMYPWKTTSDIPQEMVDLKVIS